MSELFCGFQALKSWTCLLLDHFTAAYQKTFIIVIKHGQL